MSYDRIIGGWGTEWRRRAPSDPHRRCGSRKRRDRQFAGYEFGNRDQRVLIHLLRGMEHGAAPGGSGRITAVTPAVGILA